ncbi:MAG: hypothetical protein ACO1Q7_02035 [Gemmatimonas sp.]
MKGASLSIVVVLVALLIGLIVGGWNRRAKIADLQLEHAAKVDRAEKAAFAAGHRKGYLERDAAIQREIQMTCDRIDGHKRFEALTGGSEELFI